MSTEAPVPPTEGAEQPSDTEVNRSGAPLDLTGPDSPLAPYFLQASSLVALILVGLLLLYARVLPLGEADLWAELYAGRSTLEQGGPARSGSLPPFAAEQRPGATSGWLGGTFFYLVYALGGKLVGGGPLRQFEGGVDLLAVLFWLLALALGLLVLGVYRRRSGSLALACVGLALLIVVVPALLDNLHTRLLGELLFLGLLGLLTPPQPSGGDPPRPPASGGDPPVGWIRVAGVALLLGAWANLDGWWPVGVLLVLLFLIGRWIEALREQGSPNPLRAFRDTQALRLLVALLGGIGVILCLNPLGPAIVSDLLAVARHPTLNQLAFWQPLNFSEWRIVHYVFLGNLVVLTILPLLGARPYRPGELTLLLGFALLALAIQGAVVFWFLLVPWLLLPALGAVAERWLPSNTEVNRSSPTNPGPIKTAVAGFVGVLLLFTLPGVGLLTGQPRSAALSVRPDLPWAVAFQLRGETLNNTPLLPALSRQIRATYPDERFTGVVLAGEYASDVLLFLLPPEQPVFLFSRVLLFSPEHYRIYAAMRSGQANWWELLDADHINLIVVKSSAEPKLLAALQEDPAWVLVAGTPNWKGLPEGAPLVLAVRKRPLVGIPEIPSSRR
jgi:hypothetical protein